MTAATGHGVRRVVAGVAVFGVLAAGTGRAATEVVARSGAMSPSGLPYSRFVGVGLGDAGHLAVLATTTAVFRAVRVGGTVRAERVFAPGDEFGGRTVIGADAPAMAANGCVVARVGFSDGSGAIYRRCGDTVERVAGVGDAVGLRTVTQFEGSVVTGGAYVAFLARLSDGNTAVVRGGSGPLVDVAHTGGASPAGGTISSLRLIGVRTTGVVGCAATVTEGRDGLFEGDGTALRKVIVEGDGSLDGTITSIDGASMNTDGLFAFLGTLENGTRGIVRADARPPLPQVGMIVHVGDDAPGVAGGIFARFVPSVVPAINGAGDVAFRVTLGGEATGAGIFIGHPDGSTRKIVTTRESVEVLTPSGATEKDTLTRLRDPVMAGDGSVVVVATPPSEGVGLFVARDAAIAELIRFGAAADLGEGDQRFRFVLPSVAGAAEDAVFLGQHDVLLAFDPAGAVRVVAALGGDAPVGGTFSDIDMPGVGSDGRVAFRGEVLAGKIGQGVFVDRGDGKGPAALAKAGRGAPGPGRFRDFPATVGDGMASVDVAGTRVAFLASLSDAKAFEGTFLKKGRGGKTLARVYKHAPGGGKYVSVDLPAVVDAKHYAFSGLVRDDTTRQAIFWRNGRKTRIVARQELETGVRLGGRFQLFSPPELAAGGFLFRAEVSPNGRDELFLALDTRRGLLLAAGDPTDDAETFHTLDRPVWAGEQVVFSGSLAGVPALRGLFALTPDGLPASDAPARPVVTLLREGRAGPEGGTISDVRPPVGNAQGNLASIVRVEGGPANQVVVRIDLSTPASP
jgi:hypothetical protein